jgi:hypothetical protein
MSQGMVGAVFSNINGHKWDAINGALLHAGRSRRYVTRYGGREVFSRRGKCQTL